MPEISMPKIPVVALVGPPNVGKSTLFNTMLGKRLAVTGPRPGTTRDRSYGEMNWRGKHFLIVDTGGLAKKSGDPLEKNIRQQTQFAIAEADIIIFVADGQLPVSAAVAAAKDLKQVLRQNKLLNQVPVFLVINKIDSPKKIQETENAFLRLGLGEATTVSAITGRGVGDLLDKISNSVEIKPIEDKNLFAKVAIVGKPNVGKSTLLNQLAGQQRAVVSPIPGTTRAAVDIDITYKGKIFRFVDTAGMRRRAKISLDVEQYSLFQATKRIEDSDIVILVLDASDRVARFEQTIAGQLKENLKGIVITLNKIDLFEKEEIDFTTTTKRTHELFPFLKFARVIPISAEKGYNVNKLLDAVIEAKISRDQLIPEDDLKQSLKEWMTKNPPRKLSSKKKPIIYGLKQVGTNPPNFALIVNEPTAIHFSYLRYIENQLRQKYGFAGTAIKIKARRPAK